MTRNRWKISPLFPQGHPLREVYPPLITQLLYNRGIETLSEADSFLHIDKSLCGDPWTLSDMHKAVQRIQQAILRGEQIAIYGDFDVDGVSATAILVKGLERLGGRVVPYIPHRLHEGHGLNLTALEELKKLGATLVITVDCGISGISQPKRERHPLSPSMDIIITDHHLPPANLPQAVAVIDPKLNESRYPFKELSGAGVAYKLLQALYQGLGREKETDEFLDLVALGTVADLMPLTRENRYLVKAGLERLKTTSILGLQSLASLSSMDLRQIDTQDISFVLAPRLNAAGRLEHANTSYELLVTDSAQKANELATILIAQNSERQRLTVEAVSCAQEQVREKGVSPLLLVHNESYVRGIIGLVAGKLCDEYYHPVIVLQTGADMCYGSCRSIPEFNITAALSQCSDLLTRFGGHAQAAGFSLPKANLPQLEAKLQHIAGQQLSGLDLRPQIEIDAIVPLNRMTFETYAKIQQLSPFGAGNTAPVFLSRGVQVTDFRTMGANESHLRLKLKQGDNFWNAVAFGLGERCDEVQVLLDIVYNLELDDWNGETKLRLNIIDFAQTETIVDFEENNN
ncbi:MAG: single-stranded-DNA-specific exonuclease RecJ [Dehalococcoidia bacterium]|nr:single-stranded-DNA-specific exonuclease RecJ [Dehalococcoidia bacterium]